MGVILNNLIPIIGSSIAMSIPWCWPRWAASRRAAASWPWAWRA